MLYSTRDECSFIFLWSVELQGKKPGISLIGDQWEGPPSANRAASGDEQKQSSQTWMR